MEDLEIVFAKLDEYISVTNEDFCNFIEKKIVDFCCKPKSIENWNKWLKLRKKQFEHLGAAVNRSPDELIMNREIPWILKHEKALLEESQRIRFYDKYRGHPNFWVTTEEACGKSRKEISITRETYPGTLDFTCDRTATLGFGYLGYPTDMMAEKGLTRDCESMKKYYRWRSNEKVQNRKMDMKPELDKMEPFKPDTDDMIVLGRGYTEPTEDVEEEIAMGPEIIVTMDESIDTKHKYWQYDDDDAYSVNEPILKIGNKYINSTSNRSGFLCYISLYSDGSGEGNKKRIRVANKGTTVVHYKWKYVQCYKNNFPLKVSQCEKPRFFFDHSNGVLLPGKNIKLLFLFKSAAQGTYKEVWQFITRPSMQAEPIYFFMYGVSMEEHEPSVSASYINNYIRKCKKDTKISKLKKEGQTVEPVKLYKFNELFNEIEKFEYNNPKLYYHRHEVQLLKSIYYKIKKKPWNYSMRTIHDAILRVKNDEMKNKFLTALKLISYSLQRPPINRYISNNVYTGVYTLLCQCINEIEIVFINLENILSLQPLPKTEILYENEELLLPEQADTDLTTKDKFDQVFHDIYKNYFKSRRVDSIKIGHVVIPMDKNTFKAGFLNTIQDRFMDIADGIRSKVKRDLTSGRRRSRLPSGTSEILIDHRERTDSQRSQPESNMVNQPGKTKRMLTAEQKKIQKQIEKVMEKKKFINYVDAKQKQKKIKFKPDSDRKRFRFIFIYQCKIILTKTIDEITTFLESTEMLEDVLDVKNPLVGTHPKMAFSCDIE